MSRGDLIDMFALRENPELEDLFRSLARTIKLQIRTHVVGTITSYNPTTQKAGVSVDSLQTVRVVDPDRAPDPSQVLKLTGTPPNQQATLKPLLLQGIPVHWPRTNSGSITFPLNPGDTGTLHVHDRSLAQWMAIGQATDPILAFTHMLADSEFYPGLHSDVSPITPPTSLTHTVLDGPLIALGANAALVPNPVLKGLEVVQAFTVYTAAVIAAGATAAAVIPPTPVSNAAFITSITAATAALAATIGTWSSTKVFTE